MPITTEPDLIERSDFTAGVSYDGIDETTEPNTLIDALNVLLDRNTGSLQTRKGYRRLLNELGVSDSYIVKQLYHYHTGSGHYLVVVVTTETTGSNNVQLWAIELGALTAARFDTAGVEWSHPTSWFWFKTIDGILYGGSQGNPMFSWDGSTYDDDASTGTYDTLVASTSPGANEVARDYAFKGNEKVTYDSDVFVPDEGIRYDTWEDGTHYSVGDLVSNKVDVGGETYWRSWKCIEGHDSVDGDNSPGDGTDTAVYWKKVRLPLPRNADGDTSKKWTFVPAAAETSVAAWFADRLFLRFDGQGDKSRAQYSAPVKPDRGEDIPDVTWNPKDWAPGNDLRGQGGGWLPFNDGSQGGDIVAFWEFGQYLIVLKRRAVFVLSGTDDTSWTVRRLARHVGCVGPQAVVEVDGLVYFLSDDGLYATDGTAVSPVEGDEKTKVFLRTRMDSALIRSVTDGHEPSLFRYEGFIGIAIPDASNATTPHYTLFYDPQTASFWPTDLPVLHAHQFRYRGITRLAFARSPVDTSTKPKDLVYEYGHATAADADDTGLTSYASTGIVWRLQTAWLNFSVKREQRRIRRIWALVKGNLTYTIALARDYATSASTLTTRSPGVATAVHIEGTIVPDAHAISVKLSGVAAPAQFMGYAVHTQPRRDRYHA